MNVQTIDAKQIIWRAALIRLTQISNPKHDDGKPTTAYVDPAEIILICRTFGGFKTPNADGTPAPYQHEIACTAVGLRGAGTLLVMETPEEVARRRDNAFGVNETLKAVP